MKNKISEDIRASLKAGKKLHVAALRLILAAIRQKEIDERKELSETENLQILDKLAKQRRESIELFTQAHRHDLKEQEQFELDLILSYLPPALNDIEVDQLIDKAITESNAHCIKDIGRVIGILKPQLQGRADLGKVSKKIKTRLTR